MSALGPNTLAATDGKEWVVVIWPCRRPRRRRGPPPQLVPALPHGPSSIGYHHTVDDALASADPRSSIAVLMPAPAVDLVQRIAEDDRLLPEKATSFQPKPSLGVLIRSLRDAPDAPS